jgi:hypothetical protein
MAEIANLIKHVLRHSCEVQITPSSVFSHSNTEVRTVSIHRHECWDPGGQKTEKMKSTSRTECVGTGCIIRFPIFNSNSTVHVWDPGGFPIDELHMMRTHHIRHTHPGKTIQMTAIAYR